MATRRRGKLLAGVGSLLGMWMAGAGCQLPSFHPGDPAAVVAQADPLTPQFRARSPYRLGAAEGTTSWEAGRIGPRTELQWSVEADQLQPQRSMAGTGVVGPNGTVEIGPYGSVSVAGLTPAQAQAAVARHLSHYLGHAKVNVRIAGAARVATSQEVAARQEMVSGQDIAAWRPTRSFAPEQGITVASVSWRPVQRFTQQHEAVVAVANWETSPAAQAEPTTSLSMNTALEPVKLRPTATLAPSDPTAAEVISRPRVYTQESVAVPGGHPGFVAGPHEMHGPGAVPNELNKQWLPPYRIEPPDILLVESTVFLPKEQPIRGQHLVRPDGTISLGIYGSVRVAGMTLEEAHEAVYQHLLNERFPKLKRNLVNVDVLAYNSKWYYVITDGAGNGQQVQRFPITGNETVLDAISRIYGLSPVSSQHHIWLARRHPGGPGTEQIMPVDWVGVTRRGSAASNYQVLPGDRIYVDSGKWDKRDTRVAKFLAPIQRILGVVLLGSETVNSIKGVNTGGAVR